MGISTNILAGIGAISVSALVFKFTRFIYIYTRTSSLPRYHHKSSTGSPPWALVTGASDGIGRGYALELARHNFNLILHGRNASKLEAVQSQISSVYPAVETRLLILDAATCSASDIAREVKGLGDLHLTVLVNNVGTGTTPSGHVFCNLEDEDPSDIDALINTNARFPVFLTRAILPLLFSHAKPALILTMGSISDVGSPYITTYSGTKAFDTAFSKALRREMIAEGRDVEVLAIMTLQVTGTATSAGSVSPTCPDASVFARAALGRVGCGWEVVEGWWLHCLLRGLLQQLMPESMFTRTLVDSVREEMKIEGKRK